MKARAWSSAPAHLCPGAFVAEEQSLCAVQRGTPSARAGFEFMGVRRPGSRCWGLPCRAKLFERLIVVLVKGEPIRSWLQATGVQLAARDAQPYGRMSVPDGRQPAGAAYFGASLG